MGKNFKNIINSKEINEWIQERDLYCLKETERINKITELQEQVDSLSLEIENLDEKNEQLLKIYKQKNKNKILFQLQNQEAELGNLINKRNNLKEQLELLNKQNISDDFRKKERNLWKLIIKNFYNFTEKEYKEDNIKTIDFNEFKEYKDNWEIFFNSKIINNKDKIEQKQQEIENLKIIWDTIENLIDDAKRDIIFLEQEKIKLINLPNNLRYPQIETNQEQNSLLTEFQEKEIVINEQNWQQAKPGKIAIENKNFEQN